MNKNTTLGSLRLTVSQNVRLRRQILGVSQEELAERAGFHRTYISQLERGVANLTVDNLEKVALALEVDPQLLLERR